MFAAIAIQIPFVVLPFLQIPPATRDCRLEVLTPQTIEERTLAPFGTAVEQYAKLHRQMARSLPMPPAFDDEDVFQSDDLRAAIVAARPQARQGEIFTAAVAMLLRARIDAAFLHHPAATTDVLINGYQPLTGEPGPAINEPFPPVGGSVRWLPLLRALPPLPRELDYALWGRDLVLIDVAANLVVDILPDALPPGARPGSVYQ